MLRTEVFRFLHSVAWLHIPDISKSYTISIFESQGVQDTFFMD